MAELVALAPVHYDQTLLVHRPWIDGYSPHPLVTMGALDWITVAEERQRASR